MDKIFELFGWLSLVAACCAAGLLLVFVIGPLLLAIFGTLIGVFFSIFALLFHPVVLTIAAAAAVLLFVCAR